MSSLSIHEKGNRRLIALVFIFFFLINIASSGGHLDHWDGMEAFFVTESMVLKHTAKLDPFVPDISKLHFDIHYSMSVAKSVQTGKSYNKTTVPLEPFYSVRSLILSAIAVPFYYMAMLLSVPPISIIGLFVNSLFISLTSVVIFCFSLDLYHSKKIALALSLIFGVGSFIWPYNTTFWVQPLQALTIVTSLFFIYKSLHYNSSFLCYYTYLNKNNKMGYYLAALGGLFLGLSVFAHPTSLVLIPGFILYSFIYMQRRNKNSKAFVCFLLILSITLFCVGLVNYLRFGSFIEFGYGYYASLATHDGWRGLIGLIMSPGAGLLFFFPVAILLPWGSKFLYRQNKGLFLLFAYIIILNWLDVGTLSFHFEPYAWSGGIAWGPRYLIPVLPFMVLIFGALFSNLSKRRLIRALILSLCIASFIINLSGSLVWYSYSYMYGWEKEHLANYKDSVNIMTWIPRYSPIILNFKSLIDGYISHIPVQKYINTSWYWASYGLAPCAYDNYLFCKFGISSIVAISSVISIVAVFLIREINFFKLLK